MFRPKVSCGLCGQMVSFRADRNKSFEIVVELTHAAKARAQLEGSRGCFQIGAMTIQYLMQQEDQLLSSRLLLLVQRLPIHENLAGS